MQFSHSLVKDTPLGISFEFDLLQVVDEAIKLQLEDLIEVLLLVVNLGKPVLLQPDDFIYFLCIYVILDFKQELIVLILDDLLKDLWNLEGL